MDYVDLKVRTARSIQRTEVYPFQFRYTPPASAVGNRGHADRGGRRQGGQQVDPRPAAQRASPATHRPLSPVPVNPPSLVGTPTVGSQLSCINGGFLNAPKSLTYAWLRNGDRDRRRHVADVHADRRRPRPRRRLPDHGDQRRRQRRRDLRRADRLQPGRPAASPSAGAVRGVRAVGGPTPVATTKAGVAFAAACKLAANRKSITLRRVREHDARSSAARSACRATRPLRPASPARRRSSSPLRSTKALKKGTKVVLKLKSGKTTKQLTVKAS